MYIPETALEVLRRLEAHGRPAYAAGGCVRDSLRGVPPADWDICTAAQPEEIQRIFSGCRVIGTGLRYGTVTLLLAGERFEITTFRRDGAYSGHRRPDQVQFMTSLSEDLRRRDFTVNAMAADKNGVVTDPFGGQEDLAQRQLRCVGDPDARFQEDALRILRALRFASQLSFSIEKTTADAMRRNCGLLREISGERVWKELTGLLTGAAAADVLENNACILLPVLPEIAPAIGFSQENPNHRRDVWGHTAEAVGRADADPLVRWALLLHDLGKPDCFARGSDGIGHFYGHAVRSEEIARDILARLRTDKASAEEICTLVRHHDDGAPPTRQNVRRWIGRYGPELLRKLLEVERADCLAHADTPKTRRRAEGIAAFSALTEQVLKEEHCFAVRDLAIDGRDVLAFGVPQGPKVGALLEQLLCDVLEERCPNEPDGLKRRLKELLEKGNDCAD